MIKNQIINYFLAISTADNTVIKTIQSPITISAVVAKKLILEQYQIDKQFKILHACYDVDSKIIYLPNASDFARDTLNDFFKVIKFQIVKDFKESYSFRPAIEGSPFSSLRYRTIESFQQATNTIKNEFKDFTNLPVIEANLNRMPTTKKTLPDKYKSNSEFIGGYISNPITFIEEYDINGKRRENPTLLLTQPAPFILIDISQTSKKPTPNAMDKEIAILNAYRDYLNVQDDSLASFADLYAIKRHLYMGWPFEEVCSLMLRDKVTNFGELIKVIYLLTKATTSLEKDGYTNPAKYPYHIVFNIDSSFPLNLLSIIGKEQYNNFEIDYDNSKSSIIIKTPVFISPDLCKQVLKARSEPFICKYNEARKVMDVKNGKLERYQLVKINKMIGDVKFKNDNISCGLNAVNSNIYSVRRMSDYYYACDFVKDICKKNNYEFKDIEVVVGPIENLMGKGTNGGFMGERAFRDNKVKLPLKLDKDVSVNPPVIIINSITFPSYASQTEVLIHEYMHYLFEINCFNYENLYNKEKGKGNKYWFLYFTDPSERLAHIHQIRFELLTGKSYDEIIRNKVGGEINTSNYPIAIKFSELVMAAIKEL